MDFDNADGPIEDLIVKVVVLDREIFCSWLDGFGVSNGEATLLVIFEYIRFKLAGKDVGA